MKYVCLCGKSFNNYDRYNYFEHKKTCKNDMMTGFQTIRLRIHSLDQRAYNLKKEIMQQCQ